MLRSPEQGLCCFCVSASCELNSVRANEVQCSNSRLINEEVAGDMLRLSC